MQVTQREGSCETSEENSFKNKEHGLVQEQADSIGQIFQSLAGLRQFQKVLLLFLH